MTIKLNLGCSDDHKAGYVNVDIAPPADVIQDLQEPWQWYDSTVEEIYAHDVFEHVGDSFEFGATPHDDPRLSCVPGKIHCMNEAWRVLKPGGVLDLAVPCVYLSNGLVNPGAFADPTHRTFWTLDDEYYFGERYLREERGRFGRAYGITALFRGDWRLVDYGVGRHRRSKIMARLEAVK